MNSYTILQSSLPGNISASTATQDDLSSIQLLLLNTAKWLKRKGSKQWSALLEGKDVHDTANAIMNGNVFVFKKDNALAGMVILFDKPTDWDKKLWANENREDAIYLHRLAINREMAGKNLGAHIMKWAEEGIVFKDKKSIRLDCMAESTALNTFYQN